MWQYDNEKCIICGATFCNDNPETAITFEHIIPESLGNRNFGGYFLCKKCNGKLGELIDAKLCNHALIAVIRLYFNLQGKGGGFPKIQGKVDDIENVSVINGKLKFPNYLKEVEPGKFIGSAATMSESISMVTKTLQRRSYNNEDIEKALSDVKKTNPIQIENPTLAVDITFDKNEFTVPFIKIAYEYALMKLGAKYQNDYLGNLLKSLLHSFVRGEGNMQLLHSLPIINIYHVVDDSLRQNGVSKELHGNYYAKYLNECFEFKGAPAHVLRIKKSGDGILLADIVLFCHPFFHYIVPITLTAESYNFSEDADYIICNNSSVSNTEKEKLKSFLQENEKCIFGFPPMTKL